MRGNSVFAFPSLHPPLTTPKTGALHVLTVCRRGFCLFPWFFFLPSNQSIPLEAASLLKNNNTLPVDSVWCPTLHSLCMKVQRPEMLCAYKLQCKGIRQKGAATVFRWKWNCVKRLHWIETALCNLNTTAEGYYHWFTKCLWTWLLHANWTHLLTNLPVA